MTAQQLAGQTVVNGIGATNIVLMDPSSGNLLGSYANPLFTSGSASASIGAFAPTGQANLTASTTSSNVALASVGPTALITNNGAVTAYLNFGTSNTITATTSGYPINSGQSIAYAVGSNTYVASITASGTAALSITTGTGLPAIADSSSGSAATTETIVQTIVTLSAGVSTTLIAANSARKSLRWMNLNTNPMTVAPGLVTVTAGQGMNYTGSQGIGYQGGSESFVSDNATNAFSAISTLGTTVAVWEGQ